MPHPSMGRPSSSGSKSKRPRSSIVSSTQTGASPKALLAEARRLSQQASRKPEGPSRCSSLKACVELFRNGLSLPLSAAEREEALFDLGEVLLELCGSLQAEDKNVRRFFDATVKKAQAAAAQVQNAVIAADVCRECVELFENVCAMKGQFDQEALVNSGVALCAWAELALEIPQDDGGGVAATKELLGRAHQRFTAALRVAPVDVELLMNYADCCVRMGELEFDHPSSSCSEPGQWDAVRRVYDQAFSAYASGCANADARIGDDLAGLLHNWGLGLFSAAERVPALEEAFKLASSAQEKFSSAFKFRPTDMSIRIGLGECLTGLVDKLAGKVDVIQQLLELLRVSRDEGYAAVLKIDSKHSAALLGLGDAHLTAGKLLVEQGLQLQAQKHLEESIQAFQRGFDLIKTDVESSSSFKYDELCDFLYNYACAAAVSGNGSKAVECLEHLLSLDALVLEDAAKDPDLGSLHSFFESRIKFSTDSSILGLS
ncbi:hypothetical protein R1flu_018581 [Riccia fluitans]|uniref:Uncharacterized protein n=1 Tax=Riccia fluitans TaxID=41844 RepID=A0ABD1ZG93_9MARC